MVMDPHGTMTCSWQDGVLHVYFKENINYEGAVLMSQHLREVIVKQAPVSWKRLVILSECALATYDTLEIVKEFDVFSAKNGCMAVAYVLGSSIQTMHLNKNPTTSRAFFKNKEEALKWLGTV